jgi:hypothetical protein
MGGRLTVPVNELLQIIKLDIREAKGDALNSNMELRRSQCRRGFTASALLNSMALALMCCRPKFGGTVLSHFGKEPYQSPKSDGEDAGSLVKRVRRDKKASLHETIARWIDECDLWNSPQLSCVREDDNSAVPLSTTLRITPSLHNGKHITAGEWIL